MSDQSLIEAVRAGETSAYGELVGKYQSRLVNTLSRQLASADDAEDIAQDAFVQAYVKLDQFHGNSAFYTWLYRIAFNLAMSHGRRRRPTTTLDGQAGPSGPDPATTQPSPEECVMTAERISLVQQAIAALADEHRQVVVLREIEGCDYEQIAEILQIPVGTVRSRLFRARMQLKEKLTPLTAPE